MTAKVMAASDDGPTKNVIKSSCDSFSSRETMSPKWLDQTFSVATSKSDRGM